MRVPNVPAMRKKETRKCKHKHKHRHKRRHKRMEHVDDMRDASGGRPTKRLRRDSPSEWRISIATSSTFRTFVGVLKEILVNCNFRLEKTAGFTGLCVDSMDSSLVCMVKGRFECSIETNVDLENESFCVSLENLKTLLKEVDSSDMLEIVRYVDTTPDITVHSMDRVDKYNCITSTLGVIDEENTPLAMDPIGSCQTVEIELARLKSLVKTARTFKASHMEFSICSPGQRGDDGELVAIPPTEDGIVHNFFSIESKGENVGSMRMFHSMTQYEENADDDGVTLRAMSTAETGGEGDGNNMLQDFGGEMVETFNETFSTMYLDLMLKSMERDKVQLFMAPGTPLIVKYPLGSDMSYLKVILAPKIK